jgi:hypothetical protein
LHLLGVSATYHRLVGLMKRMFSCMESIYVGETVEMAVSTVNNYTEFRGLQQ